MRSTRPAPLPLKNPSARPPVRLLLVLTLGVLLGHWAVLSGAPLSLDLRGAPDAAPSMAFTTRTVAAPEPVAPTVPTAQTPRPRKPQPAPTSSRRAPLPEPSGNATAAHTSDDETSVPADSAAPLEESVELAAAQPESASASNDPSASAASSPAAPATPKAPPVAAPPPLRYPAPVRLQFEVRGKERGFPFFANGELLWQHDGTLYDARYEVRIFLLGKVSQTSTGQLTPQGLEPRRFGDKRRSEVAAHFERSKGKITFSANTPDVPLTDGAQDNVSGWMQLASLFAGASGNIPTGTQLTFLSVGPRSAETWTLTVGATEKLVLPGGEVNAIHVVRTSSNERDGRADVWLAPHMDYMPVRILVTWADDHFADQQWSATEKP